MASKFTATGVKGDFSDVAAEFRNEHPQHKGDYLAISTLTRKVVGCGKDLDVAAENGRQALRRDHQTNPDHGSLCSLVIEPPVA